MQFGVGNLYPIDKTLNLIVKIVRGADSWIAHNTTQNILALTTYSFYVNWTFDKDGWYDIYFIVTDVVTGLSYTKECWWKIEDPTVIPEFSTITLLPLIITLSAAVALVLRKRRKLKH